MPKKASKKSGSHERRVVSASKRGESLGSARRILEAQALIASPHGATAEELMERFACGRTTVFRIVRAVEALGAPVHHESDGRKVRYRILEKKKLDPSERLSTAHVFGVAVAEQVLDFLKGTALKESFDDVVSLLETKLASKQFKDLRRVRDAVVVVPDAYWMNVDRTDVMDALMTGIVRRERVSLTGPSPEGGTRTFDFDPYTLVVWRYGLYTEGFSHYHNEVRLIGLDKLTDGDVKSGESFEIPASWDPWAKRRGAFGLFEGNPVTVRVQFAARKARYVKRLQRIFDADVEECPDGRVIVTITTQKTIDLTNWLVSWGEDAVVLEPANVRAEMAAIAKRMLAAYES